MPVSQAPPKARPVQYKAPLGTRWEKEKAQLPRTAFDLATDPRQIGPWILGECVGKGASGRVKVARHCETGQLAAVKILPLEVVLSSRHSLHTQATKAEKHRNGIDKEIVMMKLMDHPNVVRIYDVFEGERDLFLVLEYVDGGELFDYLVNHGKMDKYKALCYFKQIIHGLAYSHAFAVIHRDLKPENILISSLDPPHIKIADWGMAAFSPPEHRLETSCGSPHYASPEIVRGEKYLGTATDIWSCGVILYALTTGRLPFDDKSIRALLQKVKAGIYEIPSYVDGLAGDLIQKMLVVDVNNRITMPEILAHPFLRGPTPELLIIPPPTISELDRPLRSAALVKQDLISQLMLICVGASYVDLVNELLTPPGQGTLLKALYFLLNKHRESILENYGMQSPLRADGQVIKHYAAPPLKQPPPTLSELTRCTRTDSGHSREASQAPTSHATSHLLEPMSPTSSAASSRIRPSSPSGPRTPRSSYMRRARPVSSPVTSNENDTGSDIVTTSQDAKVTRRPIRPRTQTTDGLPYSQQRYTPVVPPASPSPAELMYVGSPRVQSRTPVVPALPMVDEADRTVLHLARPDVEDPRLKKTIEEVERSLGQLLQDRKKQKQTQAGFGLGLEVSGSEPQDMDVSSIMAVDEHPTFTTPKQLRPKDDNIRSPVPDGRGDFRYSLPNKKALKLASPARAQTHNGAGGKNPGKENTSGDLSLASEEDDSFMKIEKTDVDMDVVAADARLLARKQSRVRGRRYTTHLTHSKRHSEAPAGVNAPGITSPMSPQPTPSATIASPSIAVGEVKGWFANLFNWKAQQYVLHSVDNCLATRDEAARIFQALGCQVVLEDAQGWGVLKCRMDEVHGEKILILFFYGLLTSSKFWNIDSATGMVALKSVRFRAEFSPIMGYTLGAAPHASSSHSSPSTTSSSSSGSSTHNQTKSNGSTSKAAAVPAPVSAAGPPIASTVVLVQEKGALSTFKHVHATLRKEWRGSGGSQSLREPDMNAMAVPVVGTPRLK